MISRRKLLQHMGAVPVAGSLLVLPKSLQPHLQPENIGKQIRLPELRAVDSRANQRQHQPNATHNHGRPLVLVQGGCVYLRSVHLFSLLLYADKMTR